MHDPAKQWERFGRVDPYYGVRSTDEFRRENLDAATLDRFFASGEQDVARVLESARRVAGPEFAPTTILDHGCGVGRLVVPFARGAERVVGVDVSPSMLAEARRNCDARGLGSVELTTADRLGALSPEFDLVHSFIVLQHIPPDRGIPIVETLASLVRPGGVGVLHLPIGARNRRTRLHTWATRTLPFAYNVANLVRGRPWSYPHMQMNVYELNAVSLRLARLGYERVALELSLDTDEIHYASCTMVFARPQ
jgi:2-polyprenyl-3-methyl-5-hydroxy-6-metoxy-1,4-benzoquinol methylase